MFEVQQPFKVCTGANLNHKVTLKPQPKARCFIYNDQEKSSPFQQNTKKPYITVRRPYPVVETARENANPNSNCRISIGFGGTPITRNIPSRYSLTTRFLKRNFAASPQLIKRTSCTRPQWSPFEIKKIELERKYETAQSPRAYRVSNPSFIISPAPENTHDDFKMKEYFVKKSQVSRKYTDMITRLKMEEAQAISHAVVRFKQSRCDCLEATLDSIKEEYLRTINLIQQQKLVEEEELLKEYSQEKK